LAEKILDQVADAVICRSGTINRWNNASTMLFGYSAEEALGQSVELIIPEHLRAAHWSGFDTAMTKGATKPPDTHPALYTRAGAGFTSRCPLRLLKATPKAKCLARSLWSAT
jgi:PAS domain S-box-containing protein